MGSCCSDEEKQTEERFLTDEERKNGHQDPTISGSSKGGKRTTGTTSLDGGVPVRKSSGKPAVSDKTGKLHRKAPNPSFDKEELGSGNLPRPGTSTTPSAGTGSASLRLQEYQKIAYLGSGSFAEVTLAKKVSTGRLYAMKKIKKKLIEERGEIEHTVTERRLLGELQHPFLVELHEAFQSQQCFYLLLSYAAGGDMHALLTRSPRQSLAAVFFYAFEISLALEFLHQGSFLYRDLKPENILIEEEGHVLLTDFGVAKKLTAERTASFCGTLLYSAPEVHLNEPQNYKVDWWSLGCVVFELINGRRPFDGEGGEMQQIASIVERDVSVKEGDFTVQEGLDYKSTEEREEAESAMKALKEMTLALLKRDPTKRLGGADVFQQPFFSHPYFAIQYDSLKSASPDSWIGMVEGKKLTPPFKPILASSVDVQYFTQACPVNMKSHRLSVATRSASTSIATVGNASVVSHTMAPYFDFDDDGAFHMERDEGHSHAATASSGQTNATSYGRPTDGGSSPSHSHDLPIGGLDGRSQQGEDPLTDGGAERDDRGNEKDGDASDDEDDLRKHRADVVTANNLSNLSYAEEDRPSFTPSTQNRYYAGFTFHERSSAL